MAPGDLSQESSGKQHHVPLPSDTPGTDSMMVVGMGASAGGIRALQSFLRALPARPGIVFVVILHLSPEHESNLAQVLQAHTAMPVSQVRGRVPMEVDHVYVIPPNQDLKMTDGHLILADVETPRGRRAPIDVFFRTLAEVHPDGIGMLLSGGGTDGTVGLKAIKEHGGLVMVQSPEEADVETMPRSAIATGLVDFILPVADLAAKLLELRQYGLSIQRHEPPEALPEGEEEVRQTILRLLQAHTGHDFSGYKPATVLRRLERRMRVAQVETLSTYLGYLRRHPPEAQALLKDLLISVTRFFRDPHAFEALQAQVIPRLFAGKGPGDEVRVWIPGCATGEEAYSMAMLLLETAATLKAPPHLQVFASDLDEDALVYAREGLYPQAITADVSEARFQRFFVQEGAYYQVKQELRDLILFASHNLLKDPPFSRLDLIACRNLLIYLQRDLQEKVAELFHYALKPEGYLFLGSAESLDGISHLFHTLDKPHRLYRRSPLPAHGLVHLPDLPLSATPPGRTPFRPRPLRAPQAASDAALHRQALEAHAPPSLLVDAEANIVHVSETANRYLQFPSGSPSPNLYRAALPELHLELRTALYRALDKHEVTYSTPVPVEMQGQRRLVQLYVTPARGEQAPALALVVFLEIPLSEPETRPADAPAAGGLDTRLHQLEEELETARAQLRSTVESAETQHEELKAANEELQSINEEYRSTLEELETSKEELQSVNEELQTVNHELQERLKELSQANNDFHNLMAATEVATLFVDRQLRIKLYTPPLTRLFNIMPVDQGRPLAHVTHRLSDGHIVPDIQQVLDTLVPIEREMQRDDGCTYLMRLIPYRTSDDYIDGVVLTFLDITARKQAQRVLQQAHDALEAQVNARTAELAEALAALRREVAEREQVDSENRRLQVEAQQAEHFALLGRLAAGVSHEIRNPLAVLFLQADLLDEELRECAPDQHAQLLPVLGEIKSYLRRLEDIVQDYLSLVRVATVSREPLNLGALVHDFAQELAAECEAHGIPLERDGIRELGEVALHPNTFRRALLNLVDNAMEAMPQGGTLTLRGRQTEAQVQLEVSDTGTGIPAEQQARIFEPLYTTKPGGTGLGLYLVRETVMAHGGTITVASEVGRGTTFTITLPRLVADEARQHGLQD
jgi:two-component system, chemotaxis family, CheB/CheR fusion protein